MATTTMNQSWESSFFDRIAQVAGSITNRIKSSTSLAGIFSTTKVDPFGSYGVTAVLDAKNVAKTEFRTNSGYAFTVDDAKKRVPELVANTFSPDTLKDIVGYLGERLLRLETWVMKAGPLNMLVDMQSQKAVPAAAVSNKLSYVNNLKFGLQSDLRIQTGGLSPAAAFKSWDGMMYELGSSLGNIGYTMSKGQAYLGKVFSDEHDTRSLRQIAIDAKAKNISLILPTDDGTLSGKRIAGLPVLMRLKSLPAEQVHPGLSQEKLTFAFGKTLIETLEQKAKDKASRIAAEAVPGAKFDLSAFLKPKAQRDAEREAVNRVDNTPAFFVEDLVQRSPLQEVGLGAALSDEHIAETDRVRNLTIREASDSSGRYVVYCNDLNMELDVSISDLPANKYIRENHNGESLGLVEVSDSGLFNHYNNKGHVIDFRFEEEYEETNRKSMSM